MDPMNKVFKQYFNSFVIIFIDDILIYLRYKGDHMENLRIVFQVSKDHKLYAKFSKCDILLKSDAFFGYIVLGIHIEVDSKKTEAVKG